MNEMAPYGWTAAGSIPAVLPLNTCTVKKVRLKITMSNNKKMSSSISILEAMSMFPMNGLRKHEIEKLPYDERAMTPEEQAEFLQRHCRKWCDDTSSLPEKKKTNLATWLESRMVDDFFGWKVSAVYIPLIIRNEYGARKFTPFSLYNEHPRECFSEDSVLISKILLQLSNPEERCVYEFEGFRIPTPEFFVHERYCDFYIGEYATYENRFAEFLRARMLDGTVYSRDPRYHDYDDHLARIFAQEHNHNRLVAQMSKDAETLENEYVDIYTSATFVSQLLVEPDYELQEEAMNSIIPEFLKSQTENGVSVIVNTDQLDLDIEEETIGFRSVIWGISQNFRDKYEVKGDGRLCAYLTDDESCENRFTVGEINISE